MADTPNLDVLHPGDRIKIDLTGVPDSIPANETEIHEDGTVNLAFIGSILASDKTPGQLEKDITAAYVPKYYTHIAVVVTVSARFFYVGGEINGGSGSGSGNRILYTGRTTVLRAIQAAGNFTPYANKRKVQITRSISKKIEFENCMKALDNPDLDLPVYPGDFIWVGRRGL